MKKKTCFIIAAGCILLFIAIVILFANRPTPQDEMMNMLNRVENALGEEWQKQMVTKVHDLVYSNGKGNEIIYHICLTTYYEADSKVVTGLNTNAIAAVIDPGEAESCRACTVSGLPAALYQGEGRAYLCWTITPELSCVIEYDPNVELEENIFRMAESVPANSQ